MNDTFLINLFIIISLILAAGYFIGRRKNMAVAASSINTLIRVMRPAEQKVTNIGGLVGYHVEISFEEGIVKNLFGTMTLLPRHSLLYLPISILFRRFDRFFITINLTRFPTGGRAHIFERRFYRRHREGQGNGLKRTGLDLDSTGFLLFAEDSEDIAFLRELASGLETPGRLKEVSIRPERGTIELLVIPSAGENPIFRDIISGVFDMAGAPDTE